MKCFKVFFYIILLFIINIILFIYLFIYLLFNLLSFSFYAMVSFSNVIIMYKKGEH